MLGTPLVERGAGQQDENTPVGGGQTPAQARHAARERERLAARAAERLNDAEMKILIAKEARGGGQRTRSGAQRLVVFMMTRWAGGERVVVTRLAKAPLMPPSGMRPSSDMASRGNEE